MMHVGPKDIQLSLDNSVKNTIIDLPNTAQTQK